MPGEHVELTATDLALKRMLLESVDKAVARASETQEYATPDGALLWVLELTWADLWLAREDARNGCWPIACDDLVCRIVGITRLVGLTPWVKIDVDLVLDGVYERIHEAIGMATPLSDDDRRRAQEVKASRLVAYRAATTSG